MSFIPHCPAISNVLIKASANVAFRAKLLSNQEAVLDEMNLSPDEAALLADIDAPNLKEYAQQVKFRLVTHQL